MRENHLTSAATRKLRQVELLVCLTITLAMLTCTSAQAEPARVDWFSVRLPSAGNTKALEQKVPTIAPLPVTRPVISTPASRLKGATEPTKPEGVAATKWFKQFDQLVEQYCPKPADRVILNRPLMQEEGRVRQWTATASKISKNYVQLTKSLKQLPLPAQLSDLAEFRDLTIDWYHDAALVFDDMIRPRTPAKTIEELQRQLDQVKSRSETLSTTVASLNAMDHDLRKRYKVGYADQPDAPQQFAQQASK